MILFTLSPTTLTYIKPQCTCKSFTLDKLRPAHCLKSLFEKATALPDGKQYPDTEKHSAQLLGLFSHLNILGIFILTAHIGSNRYAKID